MPATNIAIIMISRGIIKKLSSLSIRLEYMKYVDDNNVIGNAKSHARLLSLLKLLRKAVNKKAMTAIIKII